MSGFEISDVLAINDKDYSITFGLYFSRREEESGSTPPCDYIQVMSPDPKSAMKRNQSCLIIVELENINKQLFLRDKYNKM